MWSHGLFPSVPGKAHLSFCTALYAITAAPCLPNTPCADDYLFSSVYRLSWTELFRKKRGKRKKWYRISYVLRRNWSMTLCLSDSGCDLCWTLAFLADLKYALPWCSGFENYCSEVLCQAVFLFLKSHVVVLPEYWKLFFPLYFHCFSSMSVSVLTTLCCKYEGSSLLLFQGRIFDYSF